MATAGKRELKLFWIPIPDDDETHLLPFLKEACEWLDSKMAGDFFIHTARWAISSDTLGWIGLDFWLYINWADDILAEFAWQNGRISFSYQVNHIQGLRPDAPPCSAARSNSSRSAVLVHCRGGMNRSPAVVAAYLVWKYGLSALQAMLVVRQARPPAKFWPRS